MCLVCIRKKISVDVYANRNRPSAQFTSLPAPNSLKISARCICRFQNEKDNPAVIRDLMSTGKQVL